MTFQITQKSLCRHFALMAAVSAAPAFAQVDANACSSPDSPKAYFTFNDGQNKDTEFTVKSCDPAFITQARKILYGTYEGGDTHIQGDVYEGRRSYNKTWSFHLKPQTVRFFENQIELCDGRPQYVQDNLQDWINQSRLWCSWSSALVREENLTCPAQEYTEAQCQEFKATPGYPEQFPCQARQCTMK